MGGVPRDCDVCPYRGMCSLNKEEELLPEKERLCFKESCVTKATLGGMMRLKIGMN